MGDPIPRQRVLIVDDDPTQARAMARVLAFADIESISASSSAEALRLLSRETVDLVMVDLHIRHESGVELVFAMRAQHHTMPVVLVSGSEPESLECEAKRCGASASLAKPFSLDLLLLVVERALAATGCSGSPTPPGK